MLLFIFLLFAMIFSNMFIELFITEESLKIKIFKITILKLKERKYYNLISKIIKQSQSENGVELDIFKNLEIRKLEIIINSKINNYNLFLFQDRIINLIIDNLYPYINQYIPNFYYCYKESGQNRISIYSSVKINIFYILITYLKGKRNGTKRYKRNAK